MKISYIHPARLTALMLIMILTAAGAHKASCQQTRLLTPDKYSDYGLVYALPRTAIEVEISLRHTIRQAGPFRLYASKYTGTDNIVTGDEEIWDITDIRMRQYGVANDTAIYRMQLKNGQNISLCVAEDGMLLSVNTTSRQPVGWLPLSNPTPMLMPPATEYLQYVNEEFSSAQSDARRAAILAASLNEVRQARLELTRGTADNMPTDGRQLELMLNSLSHQEELLLNAFCGREMTETRTARFSLVPDLEGRYVLARINPAIGFTNRNDYTGAPVYIDVQKIEGPQRPTSEDGKEMKMPRDGVMYCLPGTARISLQWNGKEYYTTTMEMAQLGTVFALDPALFTAKKAPAFAIFNPATGALMQLGEVK